MTPAIETGVPIPKVSKPTRVKYPWADMEIGNSFLVECEPDEATARRASVVSSASAWARRHAPGRKFSVRSVDGGIRVWRTA